LPAPVAGGATSGGKSCRKERQGREKKGKRVSMRGGKASLVPPAPRKNFIIREDKKKKQ